MSSRTINVETLARVEGEGALTVKIKDDIVKSVQFRIYEPPRFFEALLRGRAHTEAPDITARICGICPVAYEMSAVHAMEDAFGVVMPPGIRALRRMLYCGEWIQSHYLHIYLLHAPDFLGYQDSIRLAEKHRDIVERGLKLKKVGNEIMEAVGGRSIHPVNVRVGGFWRSPKKRELMKLTDSLKWAIDAAYDTVLWTATFPFPEFQRDYAYVALRHPEEYPVNEGRIVCSNGLDIDVHAYPEHFSEQHVKHSNALQSTMKGQGPYHTGPLARLNLNFDRLTPRARAAATEVGLVPPVVNPFKSIVARSVEGLYALEETLRLIEDYQEPEQPHVAYQTRAGWGHACTEAPRGILYHRYQVDEAGTILDATIIPPTSQNQKVIEEDLLFYVRQHLDLDDEALTWQCEQAVRNYDPCISCATHFLKLTVERE